MRIFYRLSFLFLLCTAARLGAQDIHFSQYNMSPLTLNPAQTGAFFGTARIGGIFRDQWLFLPRDYSTRSFFVDAPVIKGFRKKRNDWVGAGFLFYGDRAGTSRLGSAVQGHLTLGLSMGGSKYTVRADSLRFEEDILNNSGQLTSSDRQRFGQGSTNPKDPYYQSPVTSRSYSVGLMYRSKNKNGELVEFGVSATHINGPEYGFSLGNRDTTDTGKKANKVKRPARLVAHGLVTRNLTEKISISPSILIQSTASFVEIVPQVMGGYKWDKDTKFNAGLGYRVGDAAIILAGVDYKDFRFGASWDMRLGQLSSDRGIKGGFELAANYIIKIYKQPNVSPALLCPRL
jgi:type IX secretion system PorP/SprF family membrane protein